MSDSRRAVEARRLSTLTDAYAAQDAPRAAWLNGMARLGWRARVLISVTYAAAYFGLAWTVREFSPPRGYSPWYPPAGLTISLFVLFGAGWIVVAIPARVFTIAVLSQESWSSSHGATVARALVITASYALAGELLRRRARLYRAQVEQFAWITAVGVVAAPALATLGVSLIDARVDHERVATELNNAKVFWVGDALAVTTILPLVLLVAYAVVFGRQRVYLPLSHAGRAESTVQAALVFCVPVLVVKSVGSGASSNLAFLAVLPLLWVALRQDLIVSAAGLLVSTTIVSFTLRAALPNDSLLQMQMMLLTGALAALYAGAVRRTHEEALAALIERQDRFVRLVEHAPVHVAEFAPDGSLRNSWPSARRGWTRVVASLLGERWSTHGMVVGETGQAVSFEWQADVQGRASTFLSSAAPLQRADGAPDGVLVVTADRTELEEARTLAASDARHDELTALATRARLVESLDERLVHDPSECCIGVAAVVLDDTDLLSLTIDTTEMDRVLLDVAIGVANAASDCDEIARIGVRSFAVAMVGSEPDELGCRLATVASAVLTALHRAVTLPSGRYGISVTVGTACGAELPTEVLRRAELAAHAGQAAGGDRVVAYSDHVEHAHRAERSRVAELRRATERGEFEAWFQPIVRLGDGAIVGAEALARWRHPERGIVEPDEFIDLAERIGLIDRIDEAVLDHAVSTLDRWLAEERVPEGFSVSVNVSPLHLADPSFIEHLEKTAGRVDPSRVKIEITETTAMHDPSHVQGVLERVRDLGFPVILDDFGTGYSSMAWLHRLPVQVIKIDRSFIEGLPTDQDSRRIVELVVTLADDLELSITAEGVESADQARCLAELGCRYGQGALYGRAVPAASFPW